MRATFCIETTDLCPENEGLIESEDSKNDILPIKRPLSCPVGKGAVFGVRLDSFEGAGEQATPHVPFILSRLCCYIEDHGLQQQRLFLEGEEKSIVEDLKVEFVESGDAPLEKIGNVASVAKLLMIFFEELPEPLIPTSAQSDFVKDFERLSLNSVDTVSCLKSNVQRLPDSIYQVLKYLSRFLSRVAHFKEFNGMGPDELALIFGPLIFRPSSRDPGKLLQLEHIVNCFVKDYCNIFNDNEGCNFYIVKKGFEHDSPNTRKMSLELPLAPLCVVIPSVETEDNSEKSNVPALLIDKLTEANKDVASGSVKYDNDKLGPLITRKRKERRFSGEESPLRSSSEERPSSHLPLDRAELIRRCSSHEEIAEGKVMQAADSFTDDLNRSFDVDDYLSDTVELVNEKNHSPHPPTAKRREVDVAESDIDPICYNLSHISKQNPVAENTFDHDMDYSLEDESESSTESVIPRSASCPIPFENQDRDTETSESGTLSMSWSMLFEDSEPIRCEQPLTWSPSKHHDQHDDVILSPSVHSLRSSNYNEAPLSPSAYRSYLSHRSSHLDASVPPSPPVEQEDFAKKIERNDVADSIKQLTKKIHNIKKRLRKFDEKFEDENGYKPSHAEKSNSKEAKKMLNDLYKARKELKVLKEEAHLEHVSPMATRWQHDHILEDATNHFSVEKPPRTKVPGCPSVEDSLGLTLKNLAEDRKLVNRPEQVEAMTSEQVQDEKLAIQKALLRFESIHGKPHSKEERNTIRPLYERYRSVKRMLVRSGSFPAAKSKDICNELQPILEHETMDFPLREPIAQEAVPEEVTVSKPAEVLPKKIADEPFTLKDDPSGAKCCFLTKYDNSNFHELPLSELIFQLQKVKSEKRHLRKILKEFETEFLKLNGRKVQKEDRVPVDALYSEYKHVKARLKLLDALISKHDQHQLM